MRICQHINSFVNPDQKEEEVNKYLFLHTFEVILAHEANSELCLVS